ncbi:hypothetical protein ACFL4X_01750 [Gemmatimonadota bacterium]
MSRLLRKTVFGVFLLSLLAGGCTLPREIVAPTWQVKVSEVPLFKADTVFVGQEFLAANINSNQNDILQATFSQQVSISVGDLLKLDPAGTQLFAQVGTQDENVPLSITGELPFTTDGVQVQDAQVYSGRIIFTFTNNIPRDVVVYYTLTNVTENAQAISDSTLISGFAARQVSVDLDGARLEANGGGIDLALEVHIQPGEEAVHSVHHLVADVQTGTIFLESASGTFDIKTQFSPVRADVFDNLPVDDLDSLQLDNATITLSHVAYPFAITGAVELTGQRIGYTDRSVNAGFTSTANQPQSVVLDNSGQAGDGASPTAVSVFNMLPEELVVTGELGIQGEATLSRATTLTLDIEATVPLTFSMPPMESETVEPLELADFTRDAIGDYVGDVTLSGEIENWTPFAGTVQALVGNMPMRAMMGPFIDPVSVPAGSDTNGDGIIDQPGSSTFTIDFTAVNSFRLDALLASAYMMTVFSTEAPDMSSITESDILIFKNVFLSGTLEIDPDKTTQDFGDIDWSSLEPPD